MREEQIKYPEQQPISDEKYCEKIVEASIEKVERMGLEIGEGKTAKILISEKDSNICMKAIGDKSISPNDVEKEMYFLDKLSSNGYNVPKPVCSVITDNKNYLFMETVWSKLSIKNIIDDASGKRLEELPSGFDFTLFFEKLRKEIERMHDEEKIFHRDLHAGNVMIDKNGNPVIIDFGDAKEIYLSEEDPYRKEGLSNDGTFYTKDEHNITRTYTEFGKYLRERDWFKNK